MDLYEAVNALLEAIGEIPITDNTQAIEADVTTDVGKARTAILRNSALMQEQGYWFNKELDYPMIPNTSGYIVISASILSIYSSEVIIKDHKLYSIADRSYIFEDAQTIDVVFNVQFDDLPLVMAEYITRETAVEFYNDTFGDTQELSILQQRAQKAGILFQKAVMKHKKLNLMSGSRLLDRTTNPSALT